jgi:hypothetical protein
MLTLGGFMQWVCANQMAGVPDWARANVTLTTTRLPPACHFASAQSCIRLSDNGASCMDALAQSMSIVLS